MPNLKDIRRRIKSVKNTQKITQAMRMVAAAKVKRAETRVKAVRPYSQALRELFCDVYQRLIHQLGDLEDVRYAHFLIPRERKKIGLVVVSSDRGLCGAFNTNIVRQALRLEKELLARGLEVKFYAVGRKVTEALRIYSTSPVLGTMTQMTAAPTPYHADTIAETLNQAFLAGEIDSIEVLSTHFKSMISYQTAMTPLIPVQGVCPVEVTGDLNTASTTMPAKHRHGELLLEPSPAKTLDKLVPMYMSNVLYTLLLESAASELAARMTAMANATTNASDMIDRLTILYNKARQASITQELLEVVGGAAALG